jgi:hypothetical protein
MLFGNLPKILLEGFYRKRKTRPARAAPVSTTIQTMPRPLAEKQHFSKNNSFPVPISGNFTARVGTAALGCPAAGPYPAAN